MARFGIPILAINKEQRDAYLKSGFSPFPAGITPKEYSSEWLSVYKKLMLAMSEIGEFGFGDGDFFVDSDPVPSRFLAVEVSRESLLTEKLLSTVHGVVAPCDPAYCVDICNDWVFLKTKDGESYPNFNIFVEKDRILIYSESLELFKRLGISTCEPLNGN